MNKTMVSMNLDSSIVAQLRQIKNYGDFINGLLTRELGKNNALKKQILVINGKPVTIYSETDLTGLGVFIK
jgi:hypothetical protein